MEQRQQLDLYRQMVLIRRFEEATAEQYGRGRIGGFLHLYIGEEACAVGAIAALRADDYVVTHYRDHGHALAKGCAPSAVMAELFGKATGISGGMGGSMHLFCPAHHLMGGYAIVGGSIPLGAGIALGLKHRQEPLICLTFFGDGAVNEGEFHEALNLAALWKLPTVFFCENNQYAMGTSLRLSSAQPEIYKRAEAYAMASHQVDGMDVEAVYRATTEAVERARTTGEPTLIEALTYRFKGHSIADPLTYRTRDEEAGWRARDPILRFRDRLLTAGIPPEGLQHIEQAVEAQVTEAVAFADASPDPTPDTLERLAYAA
jgi:pyruvate dehydrogenase E1 component alpha subunit